MSLWKKELQEALRNGTKSLVRESTIEVKDDVTKYLTAEIKLSWAKLVLMNEAIKVDLTRGQETIETCTSIVKENLEKKMQTWVEVVKDAKAQ